MAAITSNNLNKIVITFDPLAVRMWQIELLQRLRAAGYRVGVQHRAASYRPLHRPDWILAIEVRRFGKGLAHPVAAPPIRC